MDRIYSTTSPLYEEDIPITWNYMRIYLGHETDFEIFWEKYFVQETDFAPLSGATLELRRHKEGRVGRGLVKIQGRRRQKYGEADDQK